MVAFSMKTLAIFLWSSSITSSSAFVPAARVQTGVKNVASIQQMIATTPSDLGMNAPPELNQNQHNNGDKKGAMIDLTGIAMSVSTNIVRCIHSLKSWIMMKETFLH